MNPPVRLTYPTALVLLAVREGVRYGFDIIDGTGLRSGTVYPILRRLEDAGLLRSHWERESAALKEGRPPRRYYTLTGAGALVARDASERYPRLIQVAGGLGEPAPRPA